MSIDFFAGNMEPNFTAWRLPAAVLDFSLRPVYTHREASPQSAQKGDLMTYEELRNQINSADEYSSRLGLVVTELDENGAKTELPILKEYHNPFRTVHGGILFTVADVTGGVAAYSNGSPVCTVDCDFHYLNAGLGAKRLYASAQKLKIGKRLLVYDVFVYDEKDVLLCKGTFTYSVIRFTENPAPAGQSESSHG